MTNSTDRTADLLRTVLTELADVVDGTTPAQLHDPTPCTEFDVTALRDHILSWLTTFAAGYADPAGKAPAVPPDYQAPQEAGAAVRAAAEQTHRALRDGAADRPLWLGESSMPGELALGMILWEYQVHGWDLAVATGQPWQPPAEASTESLAFAPGMLTPDYQGEGRPFAAAVQVTADATPLARLVGLSGRDPNWSA